MAQHNRIGARSLALELDNRVVRLILKFADLWPGDGLNECRALAFTMSSSRNDSSSDSVTKISRYSSEDDSSQSQSSQQGISDVPSLDHIRILRRREMLRDLVKQDRSERREKSDEISSSEDKKEMQRVDAQLLGISRFLRRDLSTIDPQSAFLDEEGVQKRRDLFFFRYGCVGVKGDFCVRVVSVSVLVPVSVSIFASVSGSVLVISACIIFWYKSMALFEKDVRIERPPCAPTHLRL